MYGKVSLATGERQHTVAVKVAAASPDDLFPLSFEVELAGDFARAGLGYRPLTGYAALMSCVGRKLGRLRSRVSLTGDTETVGRTPRGRLRCAFTVGDRAQASGCCSATCTLSPVS